MTWHEFQEKFEELMSQRPRVYYPHDPGGVGFEKDVAAVRGRIEIEIAIAPTPADLADVAVRLGLATPPKKEE